ncbi:MAG: zinc ribbon domain-containing protein [Chloroflexi bacterium HGW-Chloroflexi-9]|nr:MAG: zinc ribbon domain-containing protein [Chloroflexi bacterium HGW-Chloroflexi-9]
MPIYEYRCKKCSKKFDLLRRLAARDDAAKCPHCNAAGATRVQFQRVAVIGGASPDIMGDTEPEDFYGGDDDFGGDDFDMSDFE